MALRGNIVPAEELKQIIIADVVLIIAFSLTLAGGLVRAFGSPGTFISYIPIAAIGVTLGFVLHELMHKFVAQRYGAIAGFRTSGVGLAITLITSVFGFLIGIPGATMIYAQSFTKRENGLVSLAGPLTNFVVFAVFLGIAIVLAPAPGSYLSEAISFTIFINLLLAFFNMLPIFPLDGSKVLAWNPLVYGVVIIVLLALITVFTLISLYELLFMLVFALLISLFYRQALFTR